MASVTQVSVNSAGGVPKHATPRAWLGKGGVEGDRQRDLVHHGGPDRAVCLYSAERIAALREEGHPIVAGAAGENLTIEGLDWSALAPGARLQVGAATIEITSYTAPCGHIAGALRDRRHKRLSQDLHPGWSRLYARVLVEGHVQPGDAVRLLPEGA